MWRRLLLALLAVPLVSIDLPAQTDAAGRALELVAAVRRAPQLAASAQRAAAARWREDAAGRLPDPEVEGMGSRMNGPMDDVTMWEVTVRQPLPKRGERAADRARARALTTMASADFAMTAGDLAADVAMALAEAEGAQARAGLLETQLARLDAVLRSLEVQLAAGSTGRLVDRLTVQTRVASMQLMAEEARRMAEDARAEARARLGFAPDAPLPLFSAPAPADISPERAPEYLVSTARAAEADAMVRMAHASAQPMTAVGVRFERERTAMGNEDTIGLAVMSEIPWRSRRYARAEAQAAQADRAAARSDASALRFRIQSAVARVERAERLAATARRLGAETQERLHAEYDTMVRTASVSGLGGSAVLQTVEVLEKATETDLQVIEAETAARTARAELWRYVSADTFSPTLLSSQP